LALAMASVLCFGAAGVVCAKPLPLEPYLSSIAHPGSHVFTPTLTMYIAANVPHHVEASLAAFTRDGGAMVIPGSRLEEFRGGVAALT
jgi:hypothetical protein